MVVSAHVVGEAGMGKTRLLSDFLARCVSRGDLVVRVGPDSTWAKIGDACVREAIRELATLPPEASEAQWQDASVGAKRGLSLLFLASKSAPPEPNIRRRAVADALRWAIGRARQRTSGIVVLAVDDLDFVDGSSRNAIVDVLAEPPTASALLVVAYAPGARPVGEPLAGETWKLAPLPHTAYADRLSANLVPAGTSLSPLHVEQLVAWARESTEAPPGRLADLIVRRAERLSADARLALHGLAVWGEASADALRELLPKTLDLGAALDALDRARFVAVDDRGIRIAHPLVRRIVFSSIPAGRKKELFARASELRPNAPLEVRARQATHGGSGFEALSLLDTLSKTRAAQGDLAGSVAALRHALDVARRELHRGELDDPVEAMLVFARKLAEALAAAAQWNDAEGVLREALGNAPPASHHRAHLLGVLAQVANARQHPDEARRYLAEALRVAKQSNARTLLPILERLDKTIAVA
jgi:serine/threonine-protein kinase